MFAQHRSPGPAGTCPDIGQERHFLKPPQKTPSYTPVPQKEWKAEASGSATRTICVIKCFNHTALLAG